ncbi:MAG TPA: hypothetical protein VKF82_02805 [Candidatus Eremiobacteraceae bacterium]|nr:hypothetical protein [Candidatus Eremiobacteraceae bacterium]
MLAPILISAVTIFAFAAAPAPSATPAPAAPAGPLREVTYKVSFSDRTYSGGEHYSGYSSQSNVVADSGTVTVDITGVIGDALAVDVTEIMNKTGTPAKYSGSVLPDGSVNFPPDSIKPVTRALLQYFGTQFVPADKIAPDATWDVNEERGGVSVKTNYKVTKVDGAVVTLAEKQTIKIATQNATVTTDGTVTLKPSLLVPMSGDLHQVISRLSVSGETRDDVSMRFDRSSDSRDVPAK